MLNLIKSIEVLLQDRLWSLMHYILQGWLKYRLIETFH